MLVLTKPFIDIFDSPGGLLYDIMNDALSRNKLVDMLIHVMLVLKYLANHETNMLVQDLIPGIMRTMVDII